MTDREQGTKRFYETDGLNDETYDARVSAEGHLPPRQVLRGENQRCGCSGDPRQGNRLVIHGLAEMEPGR